MNVTERWKTFKSWVGGVESSASFWERRWERVWDQYDQMTLKWEKELVEKWNLVEENDRLRRQLQEANAVIARHTEHKEVKP